MTKKPTRRKAKKYPRSLKLKACKAVLSGKLSVAEANKKYDIRSTSAISRWIYQLGLKGLHKERPKGSMVKYSEDFKIKVCLQVSSGDMTAAEACRYFGIPSATSITGWMKKYGFNSSNKTSLIKVPTFAEINSHMKSKKGKETPPELKIRELETALEQALLESEVNAKIIEIASEELEIDIRKKFNTKQSKK